MEKEILLELINEGLSTYSIAKKLKCSNSTVIYWIKNYNIYDIYIERPNSYRSKLVKSIWEEDKVKESVLNSCSLSQTLIKLGLVPRGANFRTLKKYIDKYSVDVSHFAPHRSTRKMPERFLLKNILKENISYSSSRLRERLIKEKLKSNNCEMCGQTENWKGKKISLILDHINGKHEDNRLENLRILCPNCNATLDTHCSKNKRKSIL